MPLTDRGVAQARAAGRPGGRARPDRRGRGQLTAVAVYGHRGRRSPRRSAARRCCADDDLIECDFGDWEGLTFAEVRAGWPEEMDAWLASPAVAPPGGRVVRSRSPSGCGGRCGGCVQAYPGETVVVVSHVSPIKLLLRDALAAGDAFLHRLYLDPAGISVLDLWPDGGVAVRTVNDTAHLTGL